VAYQNIGHSTQSVHANTHTHKGFAKTVAFLVDMCVVLWRDTS
jgi:hypothetical protein